MKSSAINKLTFYIEMLKARYGSGEYFIEMKISFKSGTKTFPASVKNEEGELILIFGGLIKIIEFYTTDYYGTTVVCAHLT